MRILHILDHSLPLQSGYVFRTLGIVNQQRALGWEPVLLTSGKHYAPGPPREQIGDLGGAGEPACRVFCVQLLHDPAQPLGHRRVRRAHRARPNCYAKTALAFCVVYAIGSAWFDARLSPNRVAAT